MNTPKWLSDMAQRPVLRFLVVGCGVAALDLACFLVLMHMGVSSVWANLAGMSAGFFAGLWGHHAVTFQVQEPLRWPVALRYGLTFGFNLLLGTLVLKALLMAGLAPALAKFITIGLIAASNFLVSRFFVFQRR